MVHPFPGTFIGRLLVAVTILGCYLPLAVSYNVAEHRLDYIKLGEGREYNYHYNDGVSSGFDKRKFYKRPHAFKQPYSFKNFPSPVEQIATNEFQSRPEQTSYVKQESLLPVYESHEKSIHYIPADFSSPKSIASVGAGESQYAVSGQGNPTSYMGNLAERVVQMIQLRHPSSARNSSTGGLGGGSGGHFQAPVVHYHQQHPGSYQYFNAHPAPSTYELVRPISNFPPPRPYIAPALTTTKAPYVAPFLLRTSTTTTTSAPPVAPVRRPAHMMQTGMGPTMRPSYLAPGVTNDPSFSSGSLANQLKYTTSSSRPTTSPRPAATANSHQPYEPEFDIDIRIDLRDDSA